MRLNNGVCMECLDEAKHKKQREVDINNEIEKAIGRKGFSNYLFDKFKVEDGNRAAFNACKSFNPNQDSLYLWGSAGCGKTHLAGAVFRADVKNSLFTKANSLVRWFRMRNPREEEAEIVAISKLKVLVIDDIGVQKDSDHSLSVLYEIFDRRDMDERQGLVLTSNLSLDTMATKMGDDRIASRIAGMCKIIEVKGRDRRVEKP